MTDITEWTIKFVGLDEVQAGRYPVIITEHNRSGQTVKKWQINIYDEQSMANTARQKVSQSITTGQNGPPLTEQEIERIKRDITNS